MAYPRRLLSPDEEIVREFRPHWTAILPQLGLTVLFLAAIVAAALFLGPAIRPWVTSGLALVWLVMTAAGFVRWLSTEHVLTNERVIHRYGFVSKHGREIPLEMINSVSFGQTAFERVVGSGDLLIESAGETGQTRYKDIPDPEGLQTLIYQIREDRILQLEGGRVAPSAAADLEILARLHDEGKLTDEEFEQQKRKLLG